MTNKGLSAGKDILSPDYSKKDLDRRKTKTGIPDGLESGRRPGDNISYISFYVGKQLLGIPIVQVQEVLQGQTITNIPTSSKSIAGLLNLRGQIVTAIDLRQRLVLSNADSNKEPWNVVIKDEAELFSLLVDSIGEVIEVRRDSFEESPTTLDDCWKRCCEGVHRLERGLLVVIKIEALLKMETESSQTKIS